MPKYKGLKKILGIQKKAKKAKTTTGTQLAQTSQLPTFSTRSSSQKISGSARLARDFGPSLDPTPTIVCDLGTAWMRMGFAGSPFPEVINPSLVRRVSEGDPGAVKWTGDQYFASVDDPKYIHYAHNVFKALTWGRVDLEGCSFILDDGFRRLGLDDLSGHNLLVALRPSERRDEREKLFQTLMETYALDGCSFGCQQSLALFATRARLTGVVVDSGYETTHVVPVHNGQPLLDAIVAVEVGGFDVTKRLRDNLHNLYGIPCRTVDDKEYVNRMKEKMRLIEPISGRYYKNDPPKVFKFPSGNSVAMGVDRYQCAEPLFDLSLMSRRLGGGMAQGVAEALSRCPASIRGLLADNVYPLGGTTKLLGFDERLQEELVRKYPEANAVLRFPDQRARQLACWTGAASLARTQAFAKMLVTRAEYEEEGMRACERKCFLLQ